MRHAGWIDESFPGTHANGRLITKRRLEAALEHEARADHWVHVKRCHCAWPVFDQIKASLPAREFAYRLFLDQLPANRTRRQRRRRARGVRRLGRGLRRLGRGVRRLGRGVWRLGRMACRQPPQEQSTNQENHPSSNWHCPRNSGAGDSFPAPRRGHALQCGRAAVNGQICWWAIAIQQRTSRLRRVAGARRRRLRRAREPR